MDKTEFERWQAVTCSSQHRWVEDTVTRLNGRGALYYMGGESGAFMRIIAEGNLTVGTYEGAFPHIGEACFINKAEHKFKDFNEGFQYACQLGGIKFLADLFSANEVPQEPIQGMSL